MPGLFFYLGLVSVHKNWKRFIILIGTPKIDEINF